MADMPMSSNDFWNPTLIDDNLGINDAIWDISTLIGASENNSNEIPDDMILTGLNGLHHWNEKLVDDPTKGIDPTTENIDSESVWNQPPLYFLSIALLKFYIFEQKGRFILEQRIGHQLDSSEFHNGAVVATGNPYPNGIQIVEDSNHHQRHVKEEVYPSSSIHIPSALPPSTDWPGHYDFDVSFGPQEKTTKGVSWTYSKTKNKLYVGKDVSCPINFSASEMMTDVFIRATVLYSSPEHTSEVVQRCATHIKEDTDQGLYDVEHFVRCESNMAHYEIDQLTNQRSVVVPFENPPAGQPFSTYLFKFSCFGSCAGGPNRRSLMIIFKLEQGCEEIGRRKLELKVCACPGRDRKTEEKQVKEQSTHGRSSKRGAEAEPISTLGSAFEPKRRKAVTNEKGCYTITTRDLDCFYFLKEMKKMHAINSAFKKLPPEAKRALLNQDSQPRSSDPEE